MRHLAAPTWVVLAASALGSFLAVVTITVAAEVSRAGDEFESLSRMVAIATAVVFGLPTMLIAGLLFVRRLAWPFALVAIGWMAMNAWVWAPIEVLVALWAVAVAVVLVAGLAFDWRSRRVVAPPAD